MPSRTYKCLHCGAYLAFDPETQQWKCPFCDSSFQQHELGEIDQASAQKVPHSGGAQLAYHCPSCGSEIATDETTVATHCYYCHSPVVLQGKLNEEWIPDGVLPFEIDKELAIDTFMNWAKSKKFVPPSFFKEANIAEMTGVYYPHFVTECEVDGEIEGEGRNISVRETSQHVITTTRHYRVWRKGSLHFRSILRPALTKANRKLSDGIHPFPLDREMPFNGAYLSGFVAERRDIDQAAIREDVQKEVSGYVEPMLADTLEYDSHSVTPSATIRQLASRYVLLPTWILTYPNPKDANDPYYYAMNGCTGELCGKLPIDKKKLWLTGAGAFAATLLIALLICYFLV